MPTDDFTIKERSRISSVMKSLERQHALIGISFRGSSETATSMVVDVDAKAGVFLLDELNTTAGNDLVRSGKEFSVRGNDQGVDVFFNNAKAQSIVKVSGGRCYKVELPDSILYKQRRTAFRAQVGQIFKIPVHFSVHMPKEKGDDAQPEPLILEGELTDISISGLKVTLFKVDANPVPADVRPRCSLSLALPESDETLDFDASWRYGILNEKQKTLAIGLHFADMAPQPVQDKIDRFVMQAQFAARREEADES